MRIASLILKLGKVYQTCRQASFRVGLTSGGMCLILFSLSHDVRAEKKTALPTVPSESGSSFPQIDLEKMKENLQPVDTGDAELNRTLKHWSDFSLGWVEEIINRVKGQLQKKKTESKEEKSAPPSVSKPLAPKAKTLGAPDS